MTSMTPMTRTATFRVIRVTEMWASREYLGEAGPDGLEILAFGSHSPGDREMVADRWTT